MGDSQEIGLKFPTNILAVIASKIELPTFGRTLRHSDTGRRRRGISGDRYNQA